MRGLLVSLLAACLASSLGAQVVPGLFGYLVSGTGGTSGEHCHTFDCTPRPHTATAGETLTLRVNAPRLGFFAIGISLSATSCTPLPFAGNALVLDGPLATLTVGTITQVNLWRSCWGGHLEWPLPLPASLPPGFTFATQAVAQTPLLTAPGSMASLSVAVRTTIR